MTKTVFGKNSMANWPQRIGVSALVSFVIMGLFAALPFRYPGCGPYADCALGYYHGWPIVFIYNNPGVYSNFSIINLLAGFAFYFVAVYVAITIAATIYKSISRKKRP